MSLKSRIAEKSKALVQRKTVTLPRSGEEVTVKGLMSGEYQRVNAAPEVVRGEVLACLCLEDPATPGVLLLNVNDQADRAIAAGLHIDDMTAIVEEHNRLAGIGASDATLLGNLERTESSDTSSPSATESPLPD